MSKIPPSEHNGPRAGPWRVLILDRSDGTDRDPKWIVATVADAGDVRPAAPTDQAPGELITRWAASRAGAAGVALVPLRASCWRVDEAR
jgi:hypothetical protein